MKQHIISANHSQKRWQGIPGIERSPSGRLWCTFFTGGPCEPHAQNVVMLTTSGDEGRTWKEPWQVITTPPGTRSFDPGLWLDPQGRLWLFYNTGNIETRTHQTHAIVTTTPDLADATWSPPLTLDLGVPYAFHLNKPIVLRTGRWLLPMTYATLPIPRQRVNPWKDWYAGPDQLQGVAISDDIGQTWRLRGRLEAPPWALENMLVQKNDDTVWMLIRTDAGHLWESFSRDQGETWSPATASPIANPGSRFHIRRLRSGSLALINHVDFTPSPTPPKGRQNLSLMLSHDDGQTWSAPILIDGRDNAAYPDAIETPDQLMIVNDYDRYGAGEIVLTQLDLRTILPI